MSASVNPPVGVSTPSDTTEMVIRVEPEHKDVVAVEFNKPLKKMFIPPDTARAIGEKFARCAYEAQFGDTPTTQHRSSITDALVTRMRVRVAAMLRGMEGQDPKIQANAIVDAILTELGPR